MKKTHLITAALGMLLWTVACANRKVPTPQQLDLSKPGQVISLSWTVIEHRGYSFRLGFKFRENDASDRNRVRQLVGDHARDQFGKPVDPGVPTPVRLVIKGQDHFGQSFAYSKTIDPILTSWSANSFKRSLDMFALKPGKYQITLENLRAAPEFAGVPTYFAIGYDAKASPIRSN